MSIHNWMYRRENGLAPTRGEGDSIIRGIYKSVGPYSSWDDKEATTEASETGSVFNLEFNPAGNVLVAACEKKCVVLFDTINAKQIHKVTDAHTDNVNCVKFLDNYNFATCSDDTTVALWDVRYLKSKVRSLHGHSNWVKTVEYSQKNNLLVTSGFDGSIFTWDVKSHTEQGLIYQKVFHTSGLMRCRITPDGSKLVICTTGGYLIVIHNLDLTTLHKDLCGFRPTVYRLMQLGNQYIPQAAKFNHVFTKEQKKNRVELVSDFPEENDAEVILSLEIHPKGHSFLSRNASYENMNEYSCIHNLYEPVDDKVEKTKEVNPSRKRKLHSDSDDDLEGPVEDPETRSNVVFTIARSSRPRRPLLPNVRSDAFVPDIWAAEVTVQERAIRRNRARSSNSVTGYNYVYAISSGVLPGAAEGSSGARQAAVNAARARRSSETNSRAAENRVRPDSPIPSIALEQINDTDDSDSNTSGSSLDDDAAFALREPGVGPLYFIHNSQTNQSVYQNRKKLLFYTQESNLAKGFIKEPCFSADGRIICSPYENGVRFFAYNQDCSEFPMHTALDANKGAPKQLTEILTTKEHKDVVLCSRFSPREPLLVTGCRGGKIIWYHPKL